MYITVIYNYRKSFVSYKKMIMKAPEGINWELFDEMFREHLDPDGYYHGFYISYYLTPFPPLMYI